MEGGALYVEEVAEVDARDALCVLSAEQRAAVFLTCWEQLGERAVAERLGIPDATARRQLARAKGRLGRALHAPMTDERSRSLVAGEVAAAPEPPTVVEIQARSLLTTSQGPRWRRPGPRAVVAAVAVSAAVLAAVLVVRDVHDDRSSATPSEGSGGLAGVASVPAAPASHLLPADVPGGLTLVEAVDAVTVQPFGPTTTVQVFSRPDGAIARLAVDPWQERDARSRLPGFGRAFARGGGAGWRNETLGYGLLWFRERGTRVVLQTIGLSVSEAVTFADKLVARGVVAVDGFDPPPGPFRLVSERLAADPRPVVGIRSSVTWSAHATGGPHVRLVTTEADAREAWRPLLDGSGQLLQVGPFTVRQTTDPTGTAFSWAEGATTYRLEGVGGSEADLTAVLRSLHAVDGSTWRQAGGCGSGRDGVVAGDGLGRGGRRDGEPPRRKTAARSRRCASPGPVIARRAAC